MSKAILEFSLPEDLDDFTMSHSANNLYIAIGEYSNRLRSMYKHENIETIGTFDARKMLFSVLNEHGIDLNLIS